MFSKVLERCGAQTPSKASLDKLKKEQNLLPQAGLLGPQAVILTPT